MTEASELPQQADKLLDVLRHDYTGYGMEFYERPSTPTSHRIRAVHFGRYGSSDWEMSGSILRDDLGNDPDRKRVSVLNAAGPSDQSNLNKFAKNAMGNAVSEAMGYWINVTQKDDASKNKTSRTIDFEYPTVDVLNDFVTKVFGEEKSLRYRGFDGGYYKAVDFWPPFIKDGEVITASQQPAATHEHGFFHIIGDLGIGGDFLESIQASMGKYWDESNEEIIKAGMGKIDLLTHYLGNAFMRYGAKSDKAHEEYVKAIKFFYSFQFARDGKSVREYPLGNPTDEEVDQIAKGVEARFKKVEDYVEQFPLAA